MNKDMFPRPDEIMKMASAFYESCVLFAACDLGIFSELSRKGKADSNKIASALNLNERGTKLLLNACAALGLLIKEEDVYCNTPESEMYLTQGSPANLSGAIRYNRDVYDAWGMLTTMVKTGKPVEMPELHLGMDSGRTRTFVMSMHFRALGIGRALISMLDLKDCKTVLDVGGGPGTYSTLIAGDYPGIKCIVLDLPEIVKIADELIAGQQMSERVKTLAGDYRSIDFPKGNDAVNFFGVLHQESPESICLLLKKAYDSLNHGGRVNIMDMMTDSTCINPRFSALFAVNMALTAEHGWVFSDSELKNWIHKAGFSDFSINHLPPPMPHWLATARKR
jgi:ubiquinone/menaquinone biosynthesis C-methylase UbiE